MPSWDHGPPSPSPIACPPSSTPTSSMSSTPGAWWSPVPTNPCCAKVACTRRCTRTSSRRPRSNGGAPTATSWPTAPSGTGKHSRRSQALAPASRQECPPAPLRGLRKLHGDPEASHLLRPAAGHRDLSGPQPRRLLVGHIHDGEAAEVLLGLDERTVGEQRRAARRIDTEHRGCIIQAAGEDEYSGSPHLCQQRSKSLGLLAQLLDRVVGHPLVVEGDEVLGHVSSFAGVTPADTIHLLHEQRRPDPTPGCDTRPADHIRADPRTPRLHR